MNASNRPDPDRHRVGSTRATRSISSDPTESSVPRWRCRSVCPDAPRARGTAPRGGQPTARSKHPSLLRCARCFATPAPAALHTHRATVPWPAPTQTQRPAVTARARQLFFAVSMGHTEDVRQLIRQNVDVNTRHPAVRRARHSPARIEGRRRGLAGRRDGVIHSTRRCTSPPSEESPRQWSRCWTLAPIWRRETGCDVALPLAVGGAYARRGKVMPPHAADGSHTAPTSVDRKSRGGRRLAYRAGCVGLHARRGQFAGAVQGRLRAPRGRCAGRSQRSGPRAATEPRDGRGGAHTSRGEQRAARPLSHVRQLRRAPAVAAWKRRLRWVDEPSLCRTGAGLTGASRGRTGCPCTTSRSS
jgi:hypothetical protein